MHVFRCKYCFYSSSLELNAGQSAFKCATIVDDVMIAGIGTIGRLFENMSNMDGGVFLGCRPPYRLVDIASHASVDPAKRTEICNDVLERPEKNQ
jgi:hypothetical protein